MLSRYISPDRTGRFSIYNKAQRLQEEWETAELGSSDQVAATGVG
jgi:hypothetical protein